MTPEEEIRRAGEARQLLDNSLFREAMADVYEQLRRARQATSTTNMQAAADLLRIEQVADKFFGYFKLIADTGKFAQAHFDELAQRRSIFNTGLNMFRTMGRNAL